MKNLATLMKNLAILVCVILLSALLIGLSLLIGCKDQRASSRSATASEQSEVTSQEETGKDNDKNSFGGQGGGKETSLDDVISLLEKYDKPQVIGKVIAAMKKEGYRLTDMTYASTDYCDGFLVFLKGLHSVEILCHVPGQSNREREKQFGINRQIDSFSWADEKFVDPDFGVSLDRKQEVLQKILANFTVTSVIVRLPLPENFSWSRKTVSEYGSDVIKKLEPKFGKPAEKEFGWEGSSGGWFAGWKKPTKYRFECGSQFDIDDYDSTLEVITEQAKEVGPEDYDS